MKKVAVLYLAGPTPILIIPKLIWDNVKKCQRRRLTVNSLKHMIFVIEFSLSHYVVNHNAIKG